MIASKFRWRSTLGLTASLLIGQMGGKSSKNVVVPYNWSYYCYQSCVANKKNLLIIVVASCVVYSVLAHFPKKEITSFETLECLITTGLMIQFI
jgi:hypothetical protein